MTRQYLYIPILVGWMIILPVSALMAQFSISPGTWVTVKSGRSMMIGTNVHIKSVAGASGYLVDHDIALQHMYRSLDIMAGHKEQIEQLLYQ